MAKTPLERRLEKARQQLKADQKALESEKNAPRPIGVPQNYFAAKPFNAGMVFDPGSGTAAPAIYDITLPRYYEGAEYEPASWNKDRIIELQAKLEALGLKNYTPGRWDAQSRAAYKEVLSMANASGDTWEDMLNGIVADGGAGDGGGGGRDPLSVSITNPATLKAVLQEGAQKVFGRYMDTSIVERLIGAFQSQEAAYQTGGYAAAGYDPATGQQVGPGGGNTRVEPPSMAGLQLQQAEMMRSEHPETSEMAEFVSHFDTLLNTLTR